MVTLTDLQIVLAEPADVVAKRLLGAYLLTTIDGIETGGMIIETEAYLAVSDTAAHNARGKTSANKSLYADAGTLYVHQMRHHHLLDIVTETIDVPSSVLIRALKPTVGVSVMYDRRGTTDLKNLTNGPGKVCQALGITKSFDGMSLFDHTTPVQIKISKEPITKEMIEHTPRIGISKNSDALLRFVLIS